MMSKTPMFRLLNDHVITLEGKEYPLKLVLPVNLNNEGFYKTSNATMMTDYLKEYRLGKGAGLVMTEVRNGKTTIWFTELQKKNIKLSSEKWLNHLCCNERECCERLSAARDPKGCACMRDRAISSYVTEGYSKKRAYEVGFRIEKYTFLRCAIETFGMNENGFKVLECENFHYEIPKKVNMTEYQKEQKLLSLAQYLNPSISKLEEIDENI